MGGGIMRILALDIATKTGFAFDGPPESRGVQNFAPRAGDSPGMRFIRFSSWLRDMIGGLRPDLIVYEQAHYRGGKSTEVCVGLITHLQSVVAEINVRRKKDDKIETTSLHSREIKMYATGKGNAGKEMMKVAYVRKWGHDPIDDNECDARWLLELAKERYG